MEVRLLTFYSFVLRKPIIPKSPYFWDILYKVWTSFLYILLVTIDGLDINRSCNEQTFSCRSWRVGIRSFLNKTVLKTIKVNKELYFSFDSLNCQ